jgi:diguanylate cyclase
MSFMIFNIMQAVISIALGLLAGCWLCRRSLRQASQYKDEMLHAQQILTQVDQVALRVAKDVDDHSTRVSEISDELTSTQSHDTTTVVATISKLVKANQEMQQRLAEAESKLQEQSMELQVQITEARTDILTRLGNRRAFEDELSKRFAEFRRYGKPFSTIMLDVDQFKQFNDKHGHRVGDEMLRSIAGVLRQTVRTMDLVARYGGEEFVVILPDTTIHDARQAAERYRRAIEKLRMRFEGREFSATVSIGASELLSNEQLPRLMRRTDEALYAAKEAGRNNTHWHDGRAAHPATGIGQEPTKQSKGETAGEETKPVAESPLTAFESRPVHDGAANVLRVVSNGLGELVTNECDRTVFFWQVRQRIAEWKRGGPSFSVLLVRVDEYEHIVATGRRVAAGLALRTTRLFLTGTLRDMDLIGHYGSDCYALLLPHTRLCEAVIVAERIQKGASQCLLPTKHGDLGLTVSVGIAEFSEGDDAVRLLQRAEAAVVTAEKNRIICHNGQWPVVVDAESACEHLGASAASATQDFSDKALGS